MNTMTLSDLQNDDDGDSTSMDLATDVFAQARRRLAFSSVIVLL